MDNASDLLTQRIAHIGKDFRAVVSVGNGPGKEFVKITKKQFIFLRVFVQNGDLIKACATADITEDEGKRYFRNKNFAKFIREHLEYAANANGMTFFKWMSKLTDIFDGKNNSLPADAGGVEVKDVLRAGELIGKSLGFIRDTRTIKHERNANGPIEFIQQKQGYITAIPAPVPATGGLDPGPISVPDGRETLGQDPVRYIPHVTAIGQAPVSGVVRSTPEEPGQGHSVVGDPGHLANGVVSQE